VLVILNLPRKKASVKKEEEKDEIPKYVDPVTKENVPVEVEEKKEDIEHLSLEELQRIQEGETAEDLHDPSTDIEDAEIIEDNPYVEPESVDTPISKELEHERKIAKATEIATFLIEYSNGTYRHINDVAYKLGIDEDVATKYLNDYIGRVKDSVVSKNYPVSVLSHYNKIIEEPSKKLQYHHMERLVDVVKRYSQFDVTKTLNNHQSDTLISNKRVAVNDTEFPPLGGFSQEHQQQQQSTMIPSMQPEVDRIFDGMTALQLIRFGLTVTFGHVHKNKICDMIGPDPTPYLMDERTMKSLLTMHGITEPRADSFIQWLKLNRKYVNAPVGFLSYDRAPGSYGIGGSGGQSQQSQHIPHATGASYVPQQNEVMTDYYYQKGIYEIGLAPDHPVNRKNLARHIDQEREDEQMKQLDKRFNMLIRAQVVNSFEEMGKNKNGNSMMNPEMMMMMLASGGNMEYRQVSTDETGKPVFGFAPKLNPQGNTQDPASQITGTMAMMREMMQFMQTLGRPNETQNNFMTTMLQAMMQKTLQPEDKMDEYLKLHNIINSIKGPEVAQAAGVGGPQDLNAMVQLKRMELDERFAMKKFEVEQQKIQLDRERQQIQDKESSAGLEKLMEGVQGMAPMLMQMVQQFFVPRGVPGTVPGGAAQQFSPVETMMKAEYAKQLQAQQFEAEQARMRWEQEREKKNAEAEAERQYAEAIRRSQQQQQQQQDEEQHATITQPTMTQSPSQPGFSPDTFMPYAPEELEQILMTAKRQKAELEKYVYTVSEVLSQKKQYESAIDEQTGADPQETEIVPVSTEQQHQEEDFTKVLDSIPKDIVPTDYTGPSSEDEAKEQIDDEKEEVEL
jgi:hypothetical protein